MSNPLDHAFQLQQTPYWCGPAAVRVALTCRDIVKSQMDLAAELGTTTEGTDSSADVVRVLNAHLGEGTYAARYIAGPTATDEQVAELTAELVLGVDAGFGIVANVVGTIHPLDGGSYTYNGGHYVAVVGYRNGGDEAFVADVAQREYWVTTKALAVWIAERGYSYRVGGAVLPIEGVDYAWARPDPAVLYAAGKRFASRYLSFDRTGKNLTLGEAEQLAAAGIAVVANWEWTVGDAMGGFINGQNYAKEAVRQAAACGMPAGRPIYFSVDYDPAGDYEPVDGYFQGIATVLPVDQIGAYGSYGTLDHLLGAGLIRWAWQTYAWSGGRWHPDAHVQQYRNGVVLAGGDLDLNRAMVADYGQWTPGDDMGDYGPYPLPPALPPTNAEHPDINLADLWAGHVAGTTAYGDPVESWYLYKVLAGLAAKLDQLQETVDNLSTGGGGGLPDHKHEPGGVAKDPEPDGPDA